MAEGDFRDEQLTSQAGGWEAGDWKPCTSGEGGLGTHTHTQIHFLYGLVQVTSLRQGQGTHLANLSESPEELARNADSRHDPSLPQRDSA